MHILISMKHLYKLGVFIFFCCILYLPKISFIELNLFPLMLVAVLFFIKTKSRFFFPIYIKNILIVLSLLIFMSSLSLVLGFFSGYAEAYQVLKHFKIFLYFILIYYVIFNFKLSARELLLLLLCSLWIHIISIYLMLLNPTALEIIKNYVGFTPDYPVAYRVSGFSLGYDSASLISLFALVIQLNYSYIYHSKTKNILLSALIFITLLFTARVGVVAGILIFVLFLYKIKISWFNLISILLILLLSYYAILELTDNKTLYYALTRSTHLLSESSIKSQLGVLSSFNMIMTPEFILGNGSQAFTHNGVFSDMGYVQYIAGIGIFGLLFAMFFYVQTYYYIKDQKLISMIYLLLILIVIIASLKGPYILARHTTEIIFIVFSIGALDKKKFTLYYEKL